MKYIKRLFGMMALAVGLSVANPAHAGIPVIDAANLAQAVQQVAAWAKQYTQMAQQLQTTMQQLQNAQGVRGMANLVNNPASRNYLPQTYSDILSQGVGDWQQIYDQAKSANLNNLAVSPSNAGVQMLDESMKQAAINRAVADEAYQSASKRFADIQVLLDKVNQAPDEKDILDLQGRIEAEQVMLENESNKLNALKQASAAQDELRRQKVHQMQVSNTRGWYPSGW